LSGGTSLLTLPTKEYWSQRYNDKFDEISQEASWRISNIISVVGGHNHNAKILDLYCGFGAMVDKMVHGGFKNTYGIDSDEALGEYWDTNFLSLGDPLDTGFDDESFDLVSCFGGFERTDKHDELLEEMKRLTTKVIAIRPYDKRSFELQKKALPVLMKHRFEMIKYNPVHGYLTCIKED